MNQTMTAGFYFGDMVSMNLPIPNGDSAALEICGVYDPISPDLINQSQYSHFDAMNFIWFRGSESLYQNSSGKIFEFCFLLYIDILNQTQRVLYLDSCIPANHCVFFVDQDISCKMVNVFPQLRQATFCIVELILIRVNIFFVVD